eukprot:snap_masked-scaffold340_size202118-processed-gene-1.17 protein:Tk00684 transcript:snap_masked-scaffold340_size202118-processed-gene-1.17-mRNA-1 annotation:"hypothetical protein AND_000720"
MKGVETSTTTHDTQPWQFTLHTSRTAQRLKRLERCQKIRNMLKKNNDGRVVKFSDEKHFLVDKYLKRRNDRYIAASVKDAAPETRFVSRSKHPASSMMLGYVGADGKAFPPIWFEGSVNNPTYKKDLIHKVFPTLDATYGPNGYIWTQDGAPAHTSMNVQGYLERRLGSDGFWSKEVWPPSSPNLNPLDYSIWGHVESRACANHDSNTNTLRQSVEAVWRDMTADYVKSACQAFRSRLDKEQKNENSSLKLANSSQNVELPGNNVVPLVPSSLAPTLTRGSSFQVEPMNLTLAFCGKSVSATLIQVAQNMGYESIDQNFTQADLIWSYHCHWKKLKGIMSRMNIPQRINKIPGIHHVTMKALLGQSKWPFLLKSFYLPSQVQDLQAFRAQNPAARLLSKSPQHGQIRMFDGTVTQTRVVQELLEKPMLIDGHKFDVTMYVLVSSVDPLRVYIFGEDYKLRFSPVVYNNRSQNILGYIVQDHAMTEIEKRPSLATLIKAGYSHKAAFTIFLQRTGLDPGRIYQDMQDTVIQVLSFNAPLMREEIARDFPHLSPTSSFFHLTRWDFILDTIGRVYLLEVNGSPYMNSGTFEGFMRISRYFHDDVNPILRESVCGLGKRTGHDSGCFSSQYPVCFQDGEHKIPKGAAR